MEKVNALLLWPGPEIDVLTVFVEPSPKLWAADPDADGTIVVLRALDEHEQETGSVAGVEIVGFLDFDRWTELPDLPVLWKLPDSEPLPLEALLRRAQAELCQRGVLVSGEAPLKARG